MKDGQEGTTLEARSQIGVAAFCLCVCFSLTCPLAALGEEEDRPSPPVAGGASSPSSPSVGSTLWAEGPGAVKVHVPEGI